MKMKLQRTGPPARVELLVAGKKGPFPPPMSCWSESHNLQAGRLEVRKSPQVPQLPMVGNGLQVWEARSCIGLDL